MLHAASHAETTSFQGRSKICSRPEKIVIYSDTADDNVEDIEETVEERDKDVINFTSLDAPHLDPNVHLQLPFGRHSINLNDNELRPYVNPWNAFVSVPLPSTPMTHEAVAVTTVIELRVSQGSVALGDSSVHLNQHVKTQQQRFETSDSSSDEIGALYSSFNEDTGNSFSVASLDQEVVKTLKELIDFLLLGVTRIAEGPNFQNFTNCIDKAASYGLLNTAMLDELQNRLGTRALPTYLQAHVRMAEERKLKVSLEEKQSAAQAKKDLGELDTQIAQLQARRAVVVEKQNAMKSEITADKATTKALLQDYFDTQKVVATLKLEQWQLMSCLDEGDVAWKRITSLLWIMLNKCV
ncbi:hypothetical protein ACE6H2_010015 [Prunus campanulata]